MTKQRTPANDPELFVGELLNPVHPAWSQLPEPDQPATGGGHLIDCHVSLPVPMAGRYYAAIKFGRETRRLRRLTAERQGVLSRVIVIGILLSSAFGLFCGLYLLKSYAGIHIFHGHSPLHPLYELFFG